jgi:hypothetical protein
LMAFRTTDTVFGHPNAANIWNGRFAPTPDVRSAALLTHTRHTRLVQFWLNLVSRTGL